MREEGSKLIHLIRASHCGQQRMVRDHVQGLIPQSVSCLSTPGGREEGNHSGGGVHQRPGVSGLQHSALQVVEGGASGSPGPGQDAGVGIFSAVLLWKSYSG